MYYCFINMLYKEIQLDWKKKICNSFTFYFSSRKNIEMQKNIAMWTPCAMPPASLAFFGWQDEVIQYYATYMEHKSFGHNLNCASNMKAASHEILILLFSWMAITLYSPALTKKMSMWDWVKGDVVVVKHTKKYVQTSLHKKLLWTQNPIQFIVI